MHCSETGIVPCTCTKFILDWIVVTKLTVGSYGYFWFQVNEIKIDCICLDVAYYYLS